MHHSVKALFLTLISCSAVKPGWSKNAVNTAVFRRNPVVSHQNRPFTACYDSAGYLVLARRRLQDRSREVQRTDFRGNVRDAHNTISLMVDGDGYRHLSWAHHNNLLRYGRRRGTGTCPCSTIAHIIFSCLPGDNNL